VRYRDKYYWGVHGRRMRWEGRRVCGGYTRNTCRVLMGRAEERMERDRPD